MTNINILKYFSENDFSESLVIKYLYKADIITLVCDYAGDVLKSLMQRHVPLALDSRSYHRDLRKLDFTQVTNYEWKAGSNIFLQNFKRNYDARVHKRSVTIRQIEIASQEGTILPHKASINFGDFGLCTFEFIYFEVTRKLIRSVEDSEGSSDYKYVNIIDNKPIDFYNPFD